MSVDLPAPFSPMRQCTSPADRSKLTSTRARVPGYVLEMCSSERTGPDDPVAWASDPVSWACAVTGKPWSRYSRPTSRSGRYLSVISQ